MSAGEITLFTKSDGPLTKRISLVNGAVVSDGSACVMAHGDARRVQVAGVAELGALIEQLHPNQAIALGALRTDLPDQVGIVAKQKLNGAAGPNVIARTAADIIYRERQPALALIDFDKKAMPAGVATAMRGHGSLWSALVRVLPALRGTAHVTRRSTSAGLFRADTGEKLPASGGLHIYVAVRDGTDIERFLQVLHARCWLAGLGWLMVGAAGQLLERSIVDRMVGAPERLVFEGGPILDPPLQQDQASRRPIAIEGDVLDTLAACPPLTVAEISKLRELKAKQAQQLAPEMAQARAAFVNKRVERLVARTGMSKQAAAQTVARQCEGVLLPDVELPFDEPELAGCTVADVLADPERFEGATLADPLEGVEYGTCKARVMHRAHGSPWIHSFAHGRTVYELKLDARAVRAFLERAADNAVVKTFIELAVTADLDAGEIEELRNLVVERSGINRRTIASMVKAAQRKQAAEREQENRTRRLAERRDPRPEIEIPAPDAPWLPQMRMLNEILAAASAARLPERDIDCDITRTRKLRVPDMHALGQKDTNAD
jgi:hypothetical protein